MVSAGRLAVDVRSRDGPGLVVTVSMPRWLGAGLYKGDHGAAHVPRALGRLGAELRASVHVIHPLSSFERGERCLPIVESKKCMR